MIEAKCPTCKITGTFEPMPIGGITCMSQDEPYTKCPAITKRLDTGERTNVSPLNCSHYRQAVRLAVAKFRESEYA